jgi:micrococcal nuclease
MAMTERPTAADWPLWRYRGDVLKAIDGDTLRVRLDLGLFVRLDVDLRIAGVNAPEVVGSTRAAGEAARDWLQALVGGRRIYLQTHRDRRSFTRFVADCYAVGEGGELVSLADALVAAGHAVRWEPA